MLAHALPAASDDSHLVQQQPARLKPAPPAAPAHDSFGVGLANMPCTAQLAAPCGATPPRVCSCPLPPQSSRVMRFWLASACLVHVQGRPPPPGPSSGDKCAPRREIRDATRSAIIVLCHRRRLDTPDDAMISEVPRWHCGRCRRAALLLHNHTAACLGSLEAVGGLPIPGGAGSLPGLQIGAVCPLLTQFISH